MRKLSRSFATKLKQQPKSILFGDEARNNMLAGSSLVTRSAQVTLGPYGRNVAMESETNSGFPKITKDGVTVVKNMRLQNQYHEIGVSLIRETAHATNKYCGDGTTTSAILAHHTFKEGLKFVQAGYNPILIKRGLHKAQKVVCDYLDAISRPLVKFEDIKNASLVASNYDEEVADIIARASFKKGERGIVHLEPNFENVTKLHFLTGGTYNRGPDHVRFMDESENGKLTFKNPRVLIIDMPLENVRRVTLMMEALSKFKKPIVIFSKYCSEDCKAQILYYKKRLEMEICLITFPGPEELVSKQFEDFRCIFGGELFDEFNCEDLVNVKNEHLGVSAKFEIKSQEFFYIGPLEYNEEDKKALDKRIELVEYQYNNASSHTKILFEERLNRLSGSVCFLEFGADSESQRQELHDKLVDGLNSVKNSILHGVIPGGGSALIHASKVLEFVECEIEDEQMGIELMKILCKVPSKILCQNAGIESGYIAQKLYDEFEDSDFGYNLKTKKFENLYETGIIESVYNLKNILMDSLSVGSTMLTSEVIIAKQQRYIPTALSKYPTEIFQYSKTLDQCDNSQYKIIKIINLSSLSSSSSSFPYQVTTILPHLPQNN